MPLFRRQIGDPTTTRDSYLCNMSSGAMALDYHTAGRIQVWGGELEARQPDHVGGTDLNDLAIAWASHGETLDIRSGQGWAGVRTALAEGRAVVLHGDYDQMGAATCQSSFRGDHAVLVLPGWVMGDPLCSGFKTMPEAVLRAYAQKLSATVRFAVSRPQEDSEMYPVVTLTLLAAPRPRTFTIPANVRVNGYDPAKPSTVVATFLKASPSAAAADATASVAWVGVPAGQTAPTPRGGPFLRVVDGVFTGLLIPAALVRLGIEAATADTTPFTQAQIDAAVAGNEAKWEAWITTHP